MFTTSRVLVVGNHQERLWRLLERLKPLAHSVFVAHSSHTAIELCREFAFAAVIVDFAKMGREGVDAVEFIRSGDPSRHVPVMLLGDGEVCRTAREMGDFIGPIDIDDPDFEVMLSNMIAAATPVGASHVHRY